MKPLTRLGVLASAALATGLLSSPALAATPAHPVPAIAATQAQHAVFAQTDDPTGNHIAAYRESLGGTLRLAGTYATGGKGGVLPNSVVDHTASQGSVVYDAARHTLFTVNAGSNTVSVFAVDGTKLTLLQVLGSGGTFPVSIAVRGEQVFVLNAQKGGSIQGYVISGRRLHEVPSWNRKLGLDPTLTDFTQTPGQVAFSPDGSKLLVTTKGNTNSIDVFSLTRAGAPSKTAVHNVRAGTVPFALTFDPNGDVVVTDVATSAVTTLHLNHNGTLTKLSSVPTGQKVTCWVIRDGRYLFATNPGSGTVTSLGLNGSATPSVLTSTATDAGTVDEAISNAGRNLYVETGGSGIIDEFSVHANGTLSEIGSVTLAHGAGAEGIATT